MAVVVTNWCETCCSNKFFRLQFTNSYDKWQHESRRLHMPHVSLAKMQPNECARTNWMNEREKQHTNTHTHTLSFLTTFLICTFTLRTKERRKKKQSQRSAGWMGNCAGERDGYNVLPRAHGNFKNMLCAVSVVTSVGIRDYVLIFFAPPRPHVWKRFGYDYGIQIQIDAVAAAAANSVIKKLSRENWQDYFRIWKCNRFFILNRRSANCHCDISTYTYVKSLSKCNKDVFETSRKETKKVFRLPKNEHRKCEDDDFFSSWSKLTCSSSIIMRLMRCMIYLHFYWWEKNSVNFIIFVSVPVWQPPSKCSLLMHSVLFFFSPHHPVYGTRAWKYLFVMPSFIPTHAMACVCILMAPHRILVQFGSCAMMASVWCVHKQLRSRFRINGVKCGQRGLYFQTDTLITFVYFHKHITLYLFLTTVWLLI